MKVYVIIVTYNGKQWYDKCFNSLRASTIPVQTIVVDNTLGDEDADYIKVHFPEIHLIKTNANLGFGRANNLGMRYALDNGCDYVFLLNQDAWIEPDAIEKLVDIAEHHNDYGIISPMHLNVGKSHLVMATFCRQPNNQRLIEDLYFNRISDIYETTYIHAAAWLLPRKVLEFVGGFDPIFHHYEEDDNYINRVVYHGLKLGVCPSAQIVHDHHDSHLSNERLLIRQQQYWLVEWTNINLPFSILRMTRYCARKWICEVCKGNFKKVRFITAQWRYCIAMRKNIIHSRQENMQMKTSWL
jgi:GT2 family glycosyltransferase